MTTLSLTKTFNRVQNAIKHSARALVTGGWLIAGTALAAPANDDFANAIILAGDTGTQTGTNTINATIQAGEPDPGALNTVWFKWTCAADGTFTVDTFGSTDPTPLEWDAILGVYSGAALNALTPLGATPKDTGDKETMTIPVTAGNTYYIQLAGWNNTVAANIQVNWNFAATIYQADIVTFGPGAVVGAVSANAATINWAVPSGTNLATLAPTFTLSPGATCNRTSGAIPSPNFSAGPVVYTVTSQGASTVNNYTVTVVVANAVLWNVAGGGDWDFSTSNWFKQPSGPSTTFTDGDEATFNNSAGGTINIPSAVAPLSTTVSAASGDYVFSGGPLAGTGSLTKSGSGNLTLNGTNTYSGNTVVNGGTLVVSGTGAIGGSTGFSVAGGATLLLTGTTGAKKLWPENAAALTGAGTVNVALGGQANVGFRFDMSTFTGILNLSGGQASLNPPLSPGFVSPVSGTITVASGTTLYLGWTGFVLNTTVRLNSGTDNGENLGVLRASNGTLNGALILGANSKIGADPTLIINAVISDEGNGFGFTQVANGTVTLTAVNTYTGPTIVNSGATLQCNTPGALGGGALSINGKLNPNYVGTKTVASLTLGGVANTAAGTYGSIASGANFTDDTYFTTGSTGTVTVTAGSNYDTWLSGFTFAPSADTTASGDPDGDGVTNQKEYAFGLNPTLGSSVNPITQQLDKVTGNFQYTRRATPVATGLTYTVLTSTNLVAWTTGGATETGFTTAGNIETVTVHVTAPAVNGKLFVRVKAAPAP